MRPSPHLRKKEIILAYKVILKPIWTYDIQLWGLASISNIEILERFQGKVLRMITDAPWYVPNTVIRQDLQITSGNPLIQHPTQGPPLRISQQPDGTTRPQATETTSAHRSAHQI
jgi:hypothetical protein